MTTLPEPTESEGLGGACGKECREMSGVEHAQTTIGEAEYTALHLRVAKVLDNEWAMEQALAVAQTDWAADVKRSGISGSNSAVAPSPRASNQDPSTAEKSPHRYPSERMLRACTESVSAATDHVCAREGVQQSHRGSGWHTPPHCEIVDERFGESVVRE